MDVKVLGLAHIGIDAKDTTACADFFINTLGFERISTQEFNGGLIELIGCGTCILEIVPADEANKPHGQVNHFAMEVTDVDAMYKKLKADGLVFEGDVLTLEGFFGRGIKAAFFEGPEGMRLEIFQYL